MKDLKKLISQNKVQFIFFVAMLGLLVVALLISTSGKPVEDGVYDDPIDDYQPNDNPNDNQDAVGITDELFIVPMKDEYEIVRKFYEKDGTKEEQAKSLIKYNNTYRTSQGTGFAKKDGTSFDVIAAKSGKVVEVKETPLYGKCVVIEHDDDIKTYYYGLSEVVVVKGMIVNQKDKIGVSGHTELDKEAGNYVFFQVMKGKAYLNPEKVIGKKASEL